MILTKTSLLLITALLIQSFGVEVTVDWNNIVMDNVLAIPTFQNSVNPYYRIDHQPFTSNISTTVFKYEKELNATLVRHVPWFPYPHLAVAELKAPTTESFWDFTYIDPIHTAFEDAMLGNDIVMNYATPPTWIFQNTTYNVPNDPNQRDVGYEQGTIVKNMTLMIDYYVRLYSYFTKGGFEDEIGVWHQGHSFKCWSWIEIFNEVASEHKHTPQTYTDMYDALVPALKDICPDAKFLGLGLSRYEPDWFKYFLDAKNHVSGTPIDGVSFHNYVQSKSDDLDVVAIEYHIGVDKFVHQVDEYLAIKQELSPAVWTFINEIGCAYDKKEFPSKFWSVCAGVYATMYAKLSLLGVEVVGMSQMIGFINGTYNTEWPSTSMVDWRTGEPNERYWTLKLLIDFLGRRGKTLFKTNVEPSLDVAIFAQAYETENGKRLLIVNRLSVTQKLSVAGASNATFCVVEPHGYQCATRGDSITMKGFGIGLLVW